MNNDSFNKAVEGQFLEGLKLSSLEELAIKLVTERIPGNRKGSDKPAYQHSMDVSNHLERLKYDPEVWIAGLLHDIVEDGSTSLDELRSLGFTERIVELVRLCSHDASIEGGDARWVCMMAGLVRAQDANAWAIKIADILSNIADSSTMEPGRRDFLRNVKGKMLLSISSPIMKETEIWKELERAVQ